MSNRGNVLSVRYKFKAEETVKHRVCSIVNVGFRRSGYLL
jgi:hypothetical protein